MSDLTPEQEKIWEGLTAGFEVPEIDQAPIRLQVDAILETPAELLVAIHDNQPRLTAEERELADDFFALFWERGDLKAAIAELPYRQGDFGLEIVLRFPSSEEVGQG